ncbi:hypothetical protein NEIRO03_2695 [Nematocida sp. AWRm78]|nr:hypothetical protein NEIRO03_2695 [Nematocida sp. AWRm78]
MEVGSRQEVCRNFPAEPVRAEKGGRWKSPRRRATLSSIVCVVGRRGRREAARRRAVERPRAQILEGVAGLAPRADEEKGFREERAGPKARSVRGEGEENTPPRALRQRRGRLDARGARGAERHLC